MVISGTTGKIIPVDKKGTRLAIDGEKTRPDKEKEEIRPTDAKGSADVEE